MMPHSLKWTTGAEVESRAFLCSWRVELMLRMKPGATDLFLNLKCRFTLTTRWKGLEAGKLYVMPTDAEGHRACLDEMPKGVTKLGYERFKSPPRRLLKSQNIFLAAYWPTCTLILVGLCHQTAFGVLQRTHTCQCTTFMTNVSKYWSTGKTFIVSQGSDGRVPADLRSARSWTQQLSTQTRQFDDFMPTVQIPSPVP